MVTHTMTKLFHILLVAVLVMSALATLYDITYGQGSSFFNQRDDKYRLLGLKRAKEIYESARAEYDRQKGLAEKKLISTAELERARSVYADAEVNYQQSLLAVLFEQQYVSVTTAVKYYARDGSRHAKITIANTSGGSAEFQKLINLDDPLFRSLQPDLINNVYVSVLNDENSIIGQPYEIKIDQLKYGQPQAIDFTLLQDLDALTVNMIYSNGSQRAMKIFLQKDAAINRVEVRSEQFSQEAELGKTAVFDLNLELYSGSENTFSLDVVNLPVQISRLFKDPVSQARLSQFKFSESTRTKKAVLEVTLPERPSGELAIDQPLPFYVVIVPRDKSEKISGAQGKQWTQEELQALDVGFVRLEILPRGTGQLLVRAPQLYQAIHAGETAGMKMDLVNEGSRRLDNIDIRVDLPLRWEKKVDPTVVSGLEINEEKSVTFAFTPPTDIAVGKYDIRVRTTGMSAGTPVSGEDKTITVEILPGTNIFGTLALIILILGLVTAVVIFGIRLSRK
jgi:hypothetical protein